MNLQWSKFEFYKMPSLNTCKNIWIENGARGRIYATGFIKCRYLTQ